MRFSVAALVLPLMVILGPTAAVGETAEPTVDLGSDLRVKPLQDHLKMFVADTDWNGTTISANGLILVGSEEILVVETPWTDEQTSRLLDWIDRELGQPVAAYVVTHAHNDRIGGIAEVHRRGIPTWGYEGTVDMAIEQGFDPPENTFVGRHDLTVAGEAVSLYHPGPGHTYDNIVVWFDDRLLLYGGCFIKDEASRGLGYTGDADVTEWPESLRRLQATLPEPQVVVPGHGSPGGAELITHTERLLVQAEQEAAD